MNNTIVDNIVEAILDRRQLKWDAFFHLFEWLLSDRQGHGLGTRVLESLCQYVFNRPFEACTIKREFQLSPIRDGKGKWADLAVAMPSFDSPTHLILMDDVDLRSSGGKRKLDNLVVYSRHARELFPTTTVRTVAITNASDGSLILPKVSLSLGTEAADFAAADGWRLLPIRIIGEWVRKAADETPSSRALNMKCLLEDFIAWSRRLDTRLTPGGDTSNVAPPD